MIKPCTKQCRQALVNYFQDALVNEKYCSFGAEFAAKRQFELELELELILSRWLWERGEKGGASLQKNKRACVRCVV